MQGEDQSNKVRIFISNKTDNYKFLQSFDNEEARVKNENQVLRLQLKNLNACLTELIDQIKDYSK